VRCTVDALARGPAPSGGRSGEVRPPPTAGRWDLEGIPVDRRACSSSFPCRAPGRVALVARGVSVVGDKL
jgi:hypothetical protein